jgi:hypothetical protein
MLTVWCFGRQQGSLEETTHSIFHVPAVISAQSISRDIWTLSRTAEFMAGGGQCSRRRETATGWGCLECRSSVIEAHMMNPLAAITTPPMPAITPIAGNIFLCEMKYKELSTRPISSRPSPMS